MPPFIPGLKLSGLFYEEAVAPILASRFPHLVYSAAMLHTGSDVMRFDTPQSMDHHWGPKASLFVSEADFQQYREQIVHLLAGELPLEIHGYPTHFANPDVDGGPLQAVESGPVNHGVRVTTIPRFFGDYIGLDPGQPIRERDWLAIPQQRLRTIASGKVFHDGLGQLEAIRRTLNWYPRDVWLYLMACQWKRIDQEEPFMARCGDVGDELGSRIVAMRLVNEVMRLCFLMEKQYAPYYKWFGSAFAQLDCAATLTPIFQQVFDGTTWKEREKRLSQAYIVVGEMHNALGITRPIEPEVASFHNRPYLVPHSARFVDALYDVIGSEVVKSLPRHVGAIGQFVDSTDVLENVEAMKALTAIYG